jgi:isopenicillin N synthase-like dioxygenase
VISGHEVSEALIEQMRSVCKAYFDLPTDEKLLLKMPADRYRGYSALAGEALASSLDNPTPPDLKELFSIGPVDYPNDDYHRFSKPPNCFADNMWPERPAGFRETFEAYYREMERVAGVLMRIFSLGSVSRRATSTIKSTATSRRSMPSIIHRRPQLRCPANCALARIPTMGHSQS